jgi:hypothetical protein
MILRIMPRGRMKKIDIEARIYKLKTALYNGEYQDKNGDWHDGHHAALNKVLDILNEYSQ